VKSKMAKHLEDIGKDTKNLNRELSY